MTATERAILDGLIGLEAAVAALKSGESNADLTALLRRLDDLAAHMTRADDAQLKHFLERKSYEKARQHLEAKAGPSASPDR